MAEYYGNICTCRKCNGIVHTIRKGDTLYLLSRHYNVTINEIMRANSNINVYNLQVGDQICIPVRRPNPTSPNILGQLLNPNQNQNQDQGQRPGRPTPIQPRDNDNDMDEEMNDEEMNRRMMNNANMNGETNLEYVETSATEMTEAEVQETSAEVTSASSECCGHSSMRVKDILQDENMTLEQLAKMLKDM